jgi:hypothetical protein
MTVTLGERQNFAVNIYSGNEDIKEGTFSLASLSEGLDIPLSEEYTATLKNVSDGTFIYVYSHHRKVNEF